MLNIKLLRFINEMQRKEMKKRDKNIDITVSAIVLFVMLIFFLAILTLPCNGEVTGDIMMEKRKQEEVEKRRERIEMERKIKEKREEKRKEEVTLKEKVNQIANSKEIAKIREKLTSYGTSQEVNLIPVVIQVARSEIPEWRSFLRIITPKDLGYAPVKKIGNCEIIDTYAMQYYHEKARYGGSIPGDLSKKIEGLIKAYLYIAPILREALEAVNVDDFSWQDYVSGIRAFLRKNKSLIRWGEYNSPLAQTLLGYEVKTCRFYGAGINSFVCGDCQITFSQKGFPELYCLGKPILTSDNIANMSSTVRVARTYGVRNALSDLERTEILNREAKNIRDMVATLQSEGKIKEANKLEAGAVRFLVLKAKEGKMNLALLDAIQKKDVLKTLSNIAGK